MKPGRNFNSFQQGAGTAPEKTSYVCKDCGHSSDNRRHFRSAEDGKTCATGHYEDPQTGEPRRARNPYARWGG